MQLHDVGYISFASCLKVGEMNSLHTEVPAYREKTGSKEEKEFFHMSSHVKTRAQFLAATSSGYSDDYFMESMYTFINYKNLSIPGCMTSRVYEFLGT